MVDDPFERYGLDPRDGPSALTERLRELIEATDDPAEQARIRAVWEELTLHPARRVRAALMAHPESRPPLGTPPASPRLRGEVPLLTPREILARPSVAAAVERDLPAETRPDEDVALADDPLL